LNDEEAWINLSKDIEINAISLEEKRSYEIENIQNDDKDKELNKKE